MREGDKEKPGVIDQNEQQEEKINLVVTDLAETECRVRLNDGQLLAEALINTEMPAIDDSVRGAEKKTVNPS